MKLRIEFLFHISEMVCGMGVCIVNLGQKKSEKIIDEWIMIVKISVRGNGIITVSKVV